MIPNLDLIRAIQRRSGEVHSRGFVSTLKRPDGNFHDHIMPSSPADQLLPINDQPHSHDLFFTPLRFSGLERKNENVIRPGVLFADLDAAPWPYSIEPSVLWETSPGMFQGVWYLDRQFDDYDEWADLNRRLTYHLKADKGGWMGSKLLRVPESVNWKRKAFGRLMRHTNGVYKVEWLQETLPILERATVSKGEGPHPTPPSVEVSDSLLAANWGQLGLRTRSMLCAQPRDRSLHIVRTIRQLKNEGIPDFTVFALIWGRPWNKWRTDRWLPEQLWSEILQAGD